MKHDDELHDLDGSTLRWFHVLFAAIIICGLGALVWSGLL